MTKFRYDFFLYLILFSALIQPISAQDTTSSRENLHRPKLSLEFPLLDMPYLQSSIKTTSGFFPAFANPSMSQSLNFSSDLYIFMHWGATKMINPKSEFKKILFRSFAVMGLDLITLYTPLGYGWLHEEYHRAVLTKNNINSFNDMNTFPFGDTEVSVHDVEDAQLVALKQEQPLDFNRLMVAGNEAQYHQIQRLQINNFFDSPDLPNMPLYWMSTFTNIIYVNQSGSDEFNAFVDTVNAQDKADISKRDFTGPDFTAWVDALFYPDKPYIDRGIHPSGVGIDRYVKPADLTDESRAYLQKMGGFQFLNLITPFLSGFSRIKIKGNAGNEVYGNFAFRHWLTPFGHDISLDVFLSNKDGQYLITLHNYNNKDGYFPGLEFHHLNHSLLNGKIILDGRFAYWMQPKNLSFYETTAQHGGSLGFKCFWNIGKFQPYLGADLKSDGWMPGNVYLDSKWTWNFGARLVY